MLHPPALRPFVVAAVLAAPPATVAAQCERTEDQLLVASDASPGVSYGYDIAMDGGLAVVGAPSTAAGGTAYLLHHDGAQWVEDLRVTDPAGGKLGEAVALAGDVAVIAAPNQNTFAGAVFTYRYDGVQWQAEQTLTASNGAAYDYFGYDVATDGDLVAVGAAKRGGDGAVYVFRFDGAQWNEEQELQGSNETTNNYFANCAVEGGTILVGARRNGSVAVDAGCGYVFEFDGVQWNETQLLSPANAQAGDYFGNTVALAGDVAVFGAFNKGGPNQQSGAAFVFRYDGVQWNEEQYLYGSDAFGQFCQFGFAVDIDEDAIVVGAPGWEPTKWNVVGTAYVFRDDGARWVEGWKASTSNAALGDFVGAGVAASAGRLLVGSLYGDTPAGADTGAVAALPLDDLALEANVTAVGAGSPLLLTTCGGLQGALMLLSAVDVNGVPTFQKVDLGPFDTAGRRAFGGPVPPGLTGLVVGFLTLGFRRPGVLAASNRIAVTFL